jgi:histone acetyltransferase MYST1
LPPKANSSSLRRGKQRKKTLCEESERESETDVDENKPHPSVKALLLCFSPFGVLLFVVVVFVVFEKERKMAFDDAVEEEDNDEQREKRNEEEEEEEEEMTKKTTLNNSARANTTTDEKTAAQTDDDDEEESDSDSEEESSSEEEDEEELAKWRNTTYEVGDRVSAFASWFQTKDKYLPARVIHETTKKETLRGVFGKGGDAAKKSGSGDGASATVVQMIKRYYCSYEGYSKRMDAWLDASKMRPLKEEDDGSNEHLSEEEEEEEEEEEAMEILEEQTTTRKRNEGAEEEEEEGIVEVNDNKSGGVVVTDAGEENEEEEEERVGTKRRRTGENAEPSNGGGTNASKGADGSESHPRASSKNKTMSNSNSNKKEKIGGGSGDIVDVAAVVAGEDGTVEATSPSARNNGTTNATILATAVAGNADAATPTVIVEPPNEVVDVDAENNNNDKAAANAVVANQKKTSASMNNNNNNKTKGGKPKEKKGTKKETQQHQHDVAAAIVKNAKNVDVLQLGAFEVDCWYRAPYPDEFTSDNRLFVCEFCLKYCKRRKTLVKHKKCCPLTHPPGNEIYRHPAEIEKRTMRGENGEEEREIEEIVRPELSVFEVDGARAATYCQNLCLLAKLFLDHKTLYHDVSQMLFYALCEKGEDEKHRVVGYFSKDKNGSQTGHNLACILTLPPYQRKGYGRFLIAFSYELTKRESWVGTPEKPLSDLGLMSYSAYWGDVISELLKSLEIGTVITLSKISKLTHLATQDVILVLEQAQILKRKSKGDGQQQQQQQQQQQGTVTTDATTTTTNANGNDSANVVIGQVVEVTAETIAKLDEIVTPAARRAKALDVNVKYLKWEGTPVSNVV